VFLSLLAAVSPVVSATDTRHTPERGSPERQSICDGARAYVAKKYVTQTKLRQPLIFKIERIEVLGNYCSFQAIPLFRDGSPISTEYIEDIVFDFCLERTDGAWRVIYDFSRTDVPDDAELKQMWRAFPREFPFILLPKFWRDHFNRIK
jgi:hypothetical protein